MVDVEDLMADAPAAMAVVVASVVNPEVGVGHPAVEALLQQPTLEEASFKDILLVGAYCSIVTKT